MKWGIREFDSIYNVEELFPRLAVWEDVSFGCSAYLVGHVSEAVDGIVDQDPQFRLLVLVHGAWVAVVAVFGCVVGEPVAVAGGSVGVRVCGVQEEVIDGLAQVLSSRVVVVMVVVQVVGPDAVEIVAEDRRVVVSGVDAAQGVLDTLLG